MRAHAHVAGRAVGDGRQKIAPPPRGQVTFTPPSAQPPVAVVLPVGVHVHTPAGVGTQPAWPASIIALTS